MSILYWNCWAVSSPRAIIALRSLTQSEKPFLVFLSETKCFKNKMENITLVLGFDCKFYVD